MAMQAMTTENNKFFMTIPYKGLYNKESVPIFFLSGCYFAGEKIVVFVSTVPKVSP